MERRAFVGMLPALALVDTQMTGLPPSSATANAPEITPMAPRAFDTYESWLGAARVSSLDYLKQIGRSDTERFMQYLALWSIGLPQPPAENWQSIPGANRPLDFAMLSAGRPFVVTECRMAPGCVQPAHCHPGGGGITICVEGQLTLRHFDLSPGQRPFTETGAEVEVRETAVVQLTKNTFTAFTPTRSNLHQLEAGPAGARCIDLVVQWEGEGQFSYLRFAKKDAQRRPAPGKSLRGRWVGMNIKDAYA